MLDEFIEANGLKAKLIECVDKVPNCKAAAHVLGVNVNDIAKTIVFVYDRSQAVLVVLLGDDKVSPAKVAKAMGLGPALQLANPKQVLEMTGYEVGGVPPISVYGVKTLVDQKLMAKEKVYAGGGDDAHLLEITPAELLEYAFEASVEDVSE
ncbi:MAG: aminoacyl-tRNA deacylase [Candidatus Diapherotrites archaeon]|uniref:Aminoacyl-tRNA deacylase n=1 Tax=Candidatus Iainarchaeum sp. TaxID=3101447 RepID=A0A8T4L6I3_9ARCH|nr:aminoacyl-tRNA deacylase [Candidatus Diapherotrites archaeon]